MVLQPSFKKHRSSWTTHFILETEIFTKVMRFAYGHTQYYCHKRNEPIIGTLYEECNVIILHRISACLILSC